MSAKSGTETETEQAPLATSRVIRVSAEVLQVITDNAKVGDTPDDVLRRRLNLPPRLPRGFRK